jgi:hypothetical protein
MVFAVEGKAGRRLAGLDRYNEKGFTLSFPS